MSPQLCVGKYQGVDCNAAFYVCTPTSLFGNESVKAPWHSQRAWTDYAWVSNRYHLCTKSISALVSTSYQPWSGCCDLRMQFSWLPERCSTLHQGHLSCASNNIKEKSAMPPSMCASQYIASVASLWRRLGTHKEPSQEGNLGATSRCMPKYHLDITCSMRPSAEYYESITWISAEKWMLWPVQVCCPRDSRMVRAAHCV